MAAKPEQYNITSCGGGILSPLAPPSRPDSPPLPNTRGENHAITKWSSLDITAWLHELGLPQYSQYFNDHCITNGEVLLQLTEEHLERMGLRIIGHRLMLVNAIDKLRRRAGLLPSAKFVNVEFLLEE